MLCRSQYLRRMYEYEIWNIANVGYFGARGNHQTDLIEMQNNDIKWTPTDSKVSKDDNATIATLYQLLSTIVTCIWQEGKWGSTHNPTSLNHEFMTYNTVLLGQLIMNKANVIVWSNSKFVAYVDQGLQVSQVWTLQLVSPSKSQA